jgi:murein DD-endopeptidase MepM/ murein hydrolase activator NlpD
MVAGGLLIAAAQGPGTIESVTTARRTSVPAGLGDSALKPTPAPAATPTFAPSATPSGPTSKPPEELTGYRWPVQRKARLTSFYGYRETGFVTIDGKRVHEGLDMASFCGDDVFAAHAGLVLAAGRRFYPFVGFSDSVDDFYARLERRGRMTDLPIAVVIDDGNGYRSVYGHLSETSVRPGQRVKAGQRIGAQGDTGNASGCHLHYELIRMDGPWMAVARERVREDRYPPFVRERVDPLRVLSLRDKDAPRRIPGIDPPKDAPRLTVSAAP